MLKNADCAILVTELPQFKELTPEDFTQSMRQPIIVDGRRAYNPELFKDKTEYFAIGLGDETEVVLRTNAIKLIDT